jgi:phospholipid/cholesterol/gamma-HCH transport system substrate-binding protein
MPADGKGSRDTAVGMLFFLTLGLLGVFTILIGDIPLFKHTWTFDALLDDVGGLEKGQDVLYAGSKIGTVKEIVTEPDKIRVRLEIRGDVRIYRNTEIMIEEKSALGGMRITMTRGTPGGGSISAGEAMTGKGLFTLTTQIKDAAQRISRLADTANETLASVRDGKGTLGKLWNEDTVYDELRTAVSDIRETASNLRSITRKVDLGEGVLGELVNNSESKQNLKEILASWRTISRKIEQGEGAMGDLIMNPDTKQEVKTAITKVREFGESVTKLKTFLGTSYTAVPDDKYSMAKIYLRMEPRADRYYLIGGTFFSIRDASRLTTPRTMEDSDPIGKFDAQIAQRFMDNRMAFRGGLLEGKIGAGLDYATTYRGMPFVVTLEGRQSYDDNRLHEDYDPFLLRLKTDLTLWKYFHILLGVNSLTERPRGMYGIGFEFQDQDLKYLVGALGTGK